MLLALLKSPWSRACFSCNNFCTTPSDTSLHPRRQSHSDCTKTCQNTKHDAAQTRHAWHQLYRHQHMPLHSFSLYDETQLHVTCWRIPDFRTSIQMGALALHLASRRAAPSSCCCHPSRAFCWAPAVGERWHMSDGGCVSCPVAASLGETPADKIHNISTAQR